MVHMDGFTFTNHRSNRRRERPGSRARRTIVRKNNIQSDVREGLLDALDSSVPLPSDRSRPSPLARQNWDQSWQRWQAKQAEEKALAEMEKLQLEMEQQRLLFGDFADEDDELLYRLGILYNEEDDNTRDTLKTSFISCEDRSSAPLFVIRQGKPRRKTRRPKWQSLPLLLSLSNLRDDIDIAQFLSLQASTPSIQHCETTSSFPFPTSPIEISNTSNSEDIPQSLPTTSASGSVHAYGSANALSETSNNTPAPREISLPPHSLESGDWTFIHDTSTNTPDLASPASETETWIFLSDDS